MFKSLPLRKLLLCSVPALCLSAALSAQVPGGGGSATPQQPTMPGQQPGTEPGMTPGMGQGSTPQNGNSYADNSFVTKAMEGDLAEVQLGQLAEQKSQSQDVKQFAQKMVSEHQQMQDKWLKPMAQQMGISEPKKPSKKDKKLMEKLQGLNGSAFDTAYIQAMVKDHQEDLKQYKAEAQTSQNPNVKQVAQQGSTVIAQHLQIAQQLAQAHNVPTEGKEVSSLK